MWALCDAVPTKRKGEGAVRGLHVNVTVDDVNVDPGGGLVIRPGPVVGVGVGVGVTVGVGVAVGAGVGVGVGDVFTVITACALLTFCIPRESVTLSCATYVHGPLPHAWL